MPSQMNHEEESNTTIRHRANQLVKGKWSTKVKIWIGTVSAGVPALALVISGLFWLNSELAWSADVQKSYVLQSIDVNQLRTDDRMWKVKHDLKKIAERKLYDNALDTDELDQVQLLKEYEFLLGQKEKWNDAEKEALK